MAPATDPLPTPAIVTEKATEAVRGASLIEVWPDADDPLKVRIQTTVYRDGGYTSVRASAWNYEIKDPTLVFAASLLEVYDLLEVAVKRVGPATVKAAIEKLTR